jgi:hypothetical protein
MSATPRSEPAEHAREVHEFVGWEPSKSLSDEDREAVEIIQEHRRGLDWSVQQALDERMANIEGELVPVCACGWKGYEEAWEPPGSRSPNGGQQFNSHRLNAEMTAATQRLAASTAAAALRHAAEAWSGDEKITRWLEARAAHIESVGRYDTETWP